MSSVLPVAVVLTVAVLLCAGVSGAEAAVSGGVKVPSSSERQTLRFWTPARMRRAKPLDARPGGRSEATVSGSAGQGEATPRRVPPHAPRRGASASSLFEIVGDPTAAGVSQNGAIFIQLGFGELARCSGTSVNAPNFSVVFTAGHCVNSGGRRGRWYRGRWAFVPGYRYGQRPFGVFPAKWIDTTRQWRASGSENFDVGAAVVMRNEKGQRLAEAVGAAGIAFGLKANQVFDVHGYPAEEPFDGETQRLCSQTPFLGHDPRSFLWSGPLNLAVDCNVTGGASGGGWTIAGDVLNGVTDYGYPDDAATDFGPYFGNEVKRLFARAAGVR